MHNIFMIMVLYLVSIIMMLNSASFLMIWAMLEINMITVCMIMKSCSSNYNSYSMKNSMFIYFTIQTLGSMLLLLSLSNTTEGFFSDHIQNTIMASAFTLKMSLFPTQFWMYSICKEVNGILTSLIMVLQKVPLVILMYSMSSSFLMFLMFINLALGSIMLLVSKDFIQMLVSSSFFGLIWMLSSFTSGALFFITFMSTYSILIYMTVEMMENKCSNEDKIFLTMSFSFLSGLPPMSMFLSKMAVFSELVEPDSLMVILLWVCSVISLSVYSKMMIKILVSYSFQSKKSVSSLMANYVIALAPMSSLLFIL